MLKNRFLLVIAVLSLLLVTMAVSGPLASDPTSAELSWPLRPVIIPVTDSPLDECFDVSIGELAACRSSIQTPVLTPEMACESPVDCR